MKADVVIEPNEDGTYTCPCGRIFGSVQLLAAHRRLHEHETKTWFPQRLGGTINQANQKDEPNMT